MSLTDVLLTLCYTALFSYFIITWRFFLRFGIGRRWIVMLFMFKILLGFVYVTIFRDVYNGGDTLDYFNDSEIVFNSLYDNPWLYLRLVFGISSANSAPDIAPYHNLL